MDPVDPAGGGREEDYGPWPLDDADQMTPFFLSSPSPPRALSPYLSLSPVGLFRLWNFDDGPNSPLDMSTDHPAAANHDGAPPETTQGTSAVVLSSPRRKHPPPAYFDYPPGSSMENCGPRSFGNEEMRSLFVWSPSPPRAPSVLLSQSYVQSCSISNLVDEHVLSLEARSSPAENTATAMVVPQSTGPGGNGGSPSEEFGRINHKWQFQLSHDDDGTVSSSVFKQKLQQALAFFKQSTYLHFLVQVWAPVKNGDRYELTTTEQPYIIGHQSIGLLPFRAASLMYRYAVDSNCAGELGLPGRVYLQKVPEWTPNVQYYSTSEYPPLNHAISYNVHGTVALSVFDPSTQSCISVIELVMTSTKVNYANEVDKICKALEAVNLRSTDMFERPSPQICNEDPISTNGGFSFRHLYKGKKEVSMKRSRSSVVWSHFSKTYSENFGTVKAICKYCNKALIAPSTYGTSHLSRHLKSVHHMDLSANTEASMESQRSSCSKVQQIREISDNLIHLIEDNENEVNCELIELDNKDVELESVNVSKEHKNGTSRSKSEVWLHFTKIVDIEDSGIVKARCIHCDQVLRADSRRNGTSRLRRHVTDFHRIKLAGSLKIKKRLSINNNQQETTTHNQGKDHEAPACHEVAADKFFVMK